MPCWPLSSPSTLCALKQKASHRALFRLTECENRLLFNGSEHLACQQMGIQLAVLSLMELQAILLLMATCPTGPVPFQHLAKPLHVMIRAQDGRRRDFLLHLYECWRGKWTNSGICSLLWKKAVSTGAKEL
ncbi:uncharacterized [Tachysurus ichikawai]